MGIETNKDFDQIFREKLHDHEVMPPEHIWAGIEASGFGASASASSNWKRWAAASVIALFLSASAYLYFDNENDVSEPITQEQVITPSNIQEEASTSVVQNNEEQQSLIAEEEVVTDAKPIIQKVEEENNFETEEKEVVNLLVYEEILEEPVIDKENIATDNPETAEERSAVPTEIVSEEQIVVVDQAVEEVNIDREPSTNKTSKAGLDFFDDDAISDMTAGHRREKHWELGIEFSPEWVTIPDNDNNILLASF